MGFDRAGYRVLLEDRDAQQFSSCKGVNPPRAQRPQKLPWVALVSSIEIAVRSTDLVIDCVPDENESKLEIFWLLDRVKPPRRIIARPTIHQSIADLASCTNRREKCISTIAASPESLARQRRQADLLLRAAPFTSDETTAFLVDFFLQLGFNTLSNAPKPRMPA